MFYIQNFMKIPPIADKKDFSRGGEQQKPQLREEI